MFSAALWATRMSSYKHRKPRTEKKRKAELPVIDSQVFFIFFLIETPQSRTWPPTANKKLYKQSRIGLNCICYLRFRTTLILNVISHSMYTHELLLIHSYSMFRHLNLQRGGFHTRLQLCFTALMTFTVYNLQSHKSCLMQLSKGLLFA